MISTKVSFGEKGATVIQVERQRGSPTRGLFKNGFDQISRKKNG